MLRVAARDINAFLLMGSKVYHPKPSCTSRCFHLAVLLSETLHFQVNLFFHSLHFQVNLFFHSLHFQVNLFFSLTHAGITQIWGISSTATWCAPIKRCNLTTRSNARKIRKHLSRTKSCHVIWTSARRRLCLCKKPFKKYRYCALVHHFFFWNLVDKISVITAYVANSAKVIVSEKSCRQLLKIFFIWNVGGRGV